MQRLEVSGAVRPIYGSLGVKLLIYLLTLGYMFRFTRNHHQALSRNTQIHYIKLLKRVYALCIRSVYFREGLMMIPSESKHVAQGQ